jgi:alkylation response protein AidB-like acyl-CoA dehydrogenase
MPNRPRITSPDDPALDELCGELAESADAVDTSGRWPARQLALCGEYGVYEWFLPPKLGGRGWSGVDVTRGYLRLSAACVTTTFIITQRTGACRRIAATANASLKARLLPQLVSGETFATVGISHLTTSRRHLKDPVLAAKEVDGGFVLDGYSPWVTGAAHAQTIVTGATLHDGRQVLVALPANLPGVQPQPPAKLVALSASHTGAVECRDVHVGREWLIDGPVENVMAGGSGAKSGGLQTSALALGLARAATDFLAEQSNSRADLCEPAERLHRERAELEADLLSLADGRPACGVEQLRARSNSLVLRAAQASLAAAKGTGYVVGHPAGRWCREALFFLVWSCPQPVMAANLCELAGIAE